MVRQKYAALNGTIDGFIPESLVEPKEDTIPYVTPKELRFFERRIQLLCSSHIRADEESLHKIRPLQKVLREKILDQLSDVKEFVLSHAWSVQSQANRELAVRKWRIFCVLLALPEIPSSHEQMYALHVFQSFLGVVWEKRGTKARLAASTVAQTTSQVRVWLREMSDGGVVDKDIISKKITKGLKEMGHKGVGVMHTQEETFAFMQRTWRERGTMEDLLYADSQEWRFKQMRRISEAHETTSHGSWTRNGQPARYLLHSDVWKEGTSIIHWHLKKTKNGGSLVREISCENAALFKHFTERFEQNEVWLSEHPSYRRESLPFFHLEGKSVHRRTIAMVSLEMMELAYKTEPGAGHLNPKKYRFNTHSDRKGGAVCMLSNVSQIEAYVRFLGDWKSLSFFDYARTTRKSSVLASRSVGAAFAEIFA